MSKGFLVSLEGPEGAGKTSVLEALIPILEDRGIEVLSTREPGGVLIGEKIREVILDPSHTEMDCQSSTTLGGKGLTSTCSWKTGYYGPLY